MYESVSNDLVAVGSTMQVFVDIQNFQLQLTVPEFFQAWKTKMEV
jgi:acyl-CoA thioesterase FadM